MNLIINKIHSFKGHKFFGLLYHSKNYFLGTAAVKAIALISLPVMTRILSPSDYGVYSIFLSYSAIFLVVLTLYSYSALGRYYYEKQDDLDRYLGTSIVFTGAVLIVFFFIFLYLQKEIAFLLNIPRRTVVFLVPVVFFSVSRTWYDQLYIPQKKSKQIAIRNGLQALFNFLLAVVLILLLKENKYFGQIYAALIVGAVFSFYYYRVLKPYYRICFNFKYIKYMLGYSVPLMPYVLSSFILAQFDRIMINSSAGPTQAGLYSFASNIGMLLTFVTSSLHLAWMPDYYQYLDDKNYQAIDHDAKKIFKIICLAGVFLIFFGKEIGMILAAKSYYFALGAIPIIVIGYIFNAFFAFYGWNIAYEKKNIYLSITVLISGVVNIVLNIIFIPRFGYMAAAVSTAVSYFIMALLAWIVSRFLLKLYTVPVLLAGKPLVVILPFIVGYYILCNLNIGLWVCLIFKFGLFIILLYGLFYKGFLKIAKTTKSL